MCCLRSLLGEFACKSYKNDTWLQDSLFFPVSKSVIVLRDAGETVTVKVFLYSSVLSQLYNAPLKNQPLLRPSLHLWGCDMFAYTITDFFFNVYPN